MIEKLVGEQNVSVFTKLLCCPCNKKCFVWFLTPMFRYCQQPIEVSTVSWEPNLFPTEQLCDELVSPELIHCRQKGRRSNALLDGRKWCTYACGQNQAVCAFRYQQRGQNEAALSNPIGYMQPAFCFVCFCCEWWFHLCNGEREGNRMQGNQIKTRALGLQFVFKTAVHYSVSLYFLSDTVCRTREL